jgi:hypothetical protein
MFAYSDVSESSHFHMPRVLYAQSLQFGFLLSPAEFLEGLQLHSG